MQGSRHVKLEATAWFPSALALIGQVNHGYLR